MAERRLEMTAANRANPGGANERSAVAALLAAAFVWGVIWYPYRWLRDAGLDGPAAAAATYGTALLIGLLTFRRSLAAFHPDGRQTLALLLLAVAAGGCNLGYVLASLHGEVVRVLLLFYLAPVWTVFLARLLLGERLTAKGGAVVLLALAGAMTMLWQPQLGWPAPQGVADWLGLGAGFSFAAFNVLSRRIVRVPIEVKTLSAFSGVLLLGLALLGSGFGHMRWPADPLVWVMIPVLGATLVVVNLVVQHGLARLEANRAVVIMLSELGFAALSSWWLADEVMSARASLGGAMIVVATLLSARRRA